MKTTTQQICTVLGQPVLQERYNKLKETNGSYVHQETTVEESYAEFMRFRELILGTTKSDLFDQITFKKRQAILAHIQNINSYLEQCQQYSYSKQQCGSHFNSIIEWTFDVTATLEESNLFLQSLGIRGKKKLTDDLTQTLEQYNGFLGDLSESKESFTELEEIGEQVRQIQQNVLNAKKSVMESQEKASQLLSQIVNHQNQSNTHFQAVAEIRENVKSLSASIQKHVEDAEAKRLGIDTFSNNIEEYKKRIENLENRAKETIEKEKKINELILSAEKALSLRSAEGISAAFSSQYLKASAWWVSFFWLLCSFCFIGLAIGIVAWIVLETPDSDTHVITFIIARFVAVAITITAATFCARQYIKQKNIAEDYAYKAVLSKSIIAFTDKLKEKGSEKSDIVNEYLEKVLAEILQDPLRQRSMKEEQIPVISVMSRTH